MSTSNAALRCLLSNSHALAQGDQMLYLLAEVGAPDVPLNKRSPLNMSITLDRSGSMTGEKIMEAQKAAHGVSELLSQDDACALVAFNEQSTVPFGSQRVDDRAKHALQKAIGGLYADDGTNILTAMKASHRELLKSRTGDTVNRMLLLSDGQDNNELDELQSEAAACRKDGIVIYTIGVGDDHDEEKLAAIAEASGGHFLYASDPGQVVDFFEQATQKMLQLAMRNLRLTVTPSMHVTITRLLDDTYRTATHPGDHPGKGDVWTVALNDMSRGDTQAVIFEIHCSHGMTGEFRIAHADVTYDLTGGGTGQGGADIILTYTNDMGEIRDGRNVEVLRRREELNVSSVLTKTMSKLRQGNISATDAAKQLDSANAQLARYGDSPVSQELTATIIKLSGGDTSSHVVKTGTQIATRIKQQGT